MSSIDIYFEPQNSPGIMAAKIWISDGSRVDPNSQKGANQLVGALLSRGCGPYSHTDIGDLVEGCGANLHCETYEDGILISLKCIESDAVDLLPVLGWMIKDPHLDTAQINLEKDLTIQALKRQKENPFYLAFDGWRHNVFGRGPYGHDPLGVIEDLETLGEKDLLPIAKELKNRRIIVVIAGSYPKDIEQQIYNIEPFNSLLQNNSKIKLRQKSFSLKSNQNNDYKSLCLQYEKTSQVVLMLGQPTIGYGHPDYLKLKLLSCHLGVGMSSQLFLELREKHGVAYDVGIHYPTREISSPFILHASTSEEKSILTTELIKNNFDKIRHEPISEKELSLAKSKYRSQIAHATQTVSQRAERKAHLLGLHLNADNDQSNLKKINTINSHDLLNTAKKHLQNPTLSLCGPENSLRKISAIWHY